MTQFSDLGLSQPVLQALDLKGYSTPTPIQEGYSLGSDNRVGRFVRFPMQDSEQIYRLLGLIEGRSLSRASNRARGNQTLSQLA